MTSAQVAFQKPLQLVEVRVRQGRDLERRRVVVAPRLRSAARSPGRQRRAPRSARRPWRSAAPAPGRRHSVSRVYWSSSGSCRTTTSHSACRSKASNQPPARAPDLHPIVQPHRQSRAQRGEPAAVGQQVLGADDRRARPRGWRNQPPARTVSRTARHRLRRRACRPPVATGRLPPRGFGQRG